MDADSTASREPADLGRLLQTLRPKLHRYCARMTGSVIDGEDIVQEALLRAVEAAKSETIRRPEAWVFRIAHNAALDFLRRARRNPLQAVDLEGIVDPSSAADAHEIAASGLRTFMRLPVTERATTILMDVLGYSLLEIAEFAGMTVPAVKAALHRGRMRLRRFVGEPEATRPVPLSESERTRLVAYVSSFNARDFDAIRDLLAEDVRLDLVGRTRLNGRREVSTYFGNYSRNSDWRLAAGLADGRPAILVFDDPGADAPAYFVMLEWNNGAIAGIRDFRYARYAAADAGLVVLNTG